MADFYPAAVRDAELQGVSTEELKRLAFDSRSGVEWLADSAVFELAERAKEKSTEALEALYVLARRGRLDALKALCRIEKLPDDLLEVAKREGYYCERVD